MAKELKKGSFVKRVSAYIIDYLIIFFIVSLVTTPFVDSKKVEKISNETIELGHGLNLGPLYWECRVLAAGPPGKSLCSDS